MIWRHGFLDIKKYISTQNEKVAIHYNKHSKGMPAKTMRMNGFFAISFIFSASFIDGRLKVIIILRQLFEVLRLL